MSHPYQMLVHAVVAALLVSAGMGAAIGIWALRRREIHGTVSFSLTLFALSGWALSSAAELVVDGLELTVLVMMLRWTVVATIAPLWLFFALRYTNRPEAESPFLALYAVVPFLAFVGAWWTNGIHHVVWGEYALYSDELPVLVFAPTLAFWAYQVYAYATTFAGMFVLLAESFEARSLFRGQTVALVVGPPIMMTPQFVYLSGLAPGPRVDLTGLGLIGFAILMTWALYRYELFGFAPVTRDGIMEAIDEAVFAFDHEARLVDVNREGRRLLGGSGLEPREAMLGRRAGEILPVDLRDFLDEGSEFGTVSLVQEGRTRHYGVRTSAISLYPKVSGTVLVVNDVTERVENERQLRVKNQQLDRFVGTVSHDLRNPLQTAIGYTELARETRDEAHFEKLEDSLDRMNRIVEDSLELARSAEEPDSTERVALEAVARDAWSQVETADATLSIETDGEVIADRSRLQRIFENLFRNAVEHGSTSPRSQTREDSVERRSTSSQDGSRPDDAVEHGSRDVTVRVTATEDGFAVADDGPGIDADDPATVFDHGYTTEVDGTGYGLSIVQTIARTHGWEVDVGNSSEGGAVFTFSNVPVEPDSAADGRGDDPSPERSIPR